MALFRRIKSPREIRNPPTPGVAVVVEQQTTVEEAKKKSLSGHRRHKSDELPKILENRESDVLKTVKKIQPPPELPPRNRVGSGGSITHVTPGWRRTQSSGTMSVSFKSTGHLPRVPPQQDYFVPADTLKNIKNPLNGHGAGVVVVHPPTQQEKRNKHMHQIIMSHNAPGFRESKRKSRSMDKLIDICDYSVPFDFIQDPEKNNDKSEGIVKSKTPELPPKSKGGTSENTTHTLPPKGKGNAPVKPSKLPNHGRHKTDGFDSSHCGSDPPCFAPPPPPSQEEEEDIEDPELTMYNSSSPLSPSPTINRVSDYEEPWDSRIRNLINPGKGSRRHRYETEPKVVTTGLTPTFDPYKSPRTQRSQSNTHESSPEPDPPRNNSRNNTEHVPEHGNTPSPPPPLPESSRPRVNTGESDYCTPPDAILHDYINQPPLHDTNHHLNGGVSPHDYINQPPVPPHSPLRSTSVNLKKKPRYPPLVPTDPHYSPDTHSLPPPAYPIETSVPLEDQL